MNEQPTIPAERWQNPLTAWMEKNRKYLLLALGILCLALLISLIFTPFYHYSAVTTDPAEETEVYSLIPSQALFDSSHNIMAMGTLIAVLAYLSICFLYFGLGLRHFRDDAHLAAKVQGTAILTFVGTGLYFAGGLVYAIIRNFSTKKKAVYSAGNLTPYVIAIVLLLAVAFVARVYASSYNEERTKARSKRRESFFCRLEFLLYALTSLVIGVATALGDILHVTFTQPAGLDDVHLNGFDTLMDHKDMGEAYQSTAFLVLFALILCCVLAVSVICCFFSRSRTFYRITLVALIAGASCSFIVALFGKYYEIAQAINEEVIRGWLSSYLNMNGDLLVYEVESSSLLLFFISMAAVIAAIIRRPYSRGVEKEAVNAVSVSGTLSGTVTGVSGEKQPDTAPAIAQTPTAAPLPERTPSPDTTEEPERTPSPDTEEEPRRAPSPDTEEKPETGSLPDGTETPVAEPTEPPAPPKRISVFTDPCPAFSELDGKAEGFAAEAEALRAEADIPMTLPALVQYVVNYARDSRLHLFYTAEDIATFIAGLGATRLTILQGMSGTGKTSLPKIFTEALCGICDIVEVESSWRDKNELLGYYNEFSRTYTPKKFTQALYKAVLNPDRLTFIVLDEMNLSRIEYYFSDFLSLMENEEDKREIKLLNVGLYVTEDEERRPYLGLTDGHTLKVPTNVWFIGTANRDESTFEISDKVYDRAHTMNFNKRAPKAHSTGDPIPRRFVSADALAALLTEARSHVVVDPDTDPTVKAVEELLAPYNISFGNRIANQISAFVSVYCACFAPSEQVKQEALERILLSKVVCKLEFKSVEDKELLAAEFRRRGLNRCSEFILHLSED